MIIRIKDIDGKFFSGSARDFSVLNYGTYLAVRFEVPSDISVSFLAGLDERARDVVSGIVVPVIHDDEGTCLNRLEDNRQLVNHADFWRGQISIHLEAGVEPVMFSLANVDRGLYEVRICTRKCGQRPRRVNNMLSVQLQ